MAVDYDEGRRLLANFREGRNREGFMLYLLHYAEALLNPDPWRPISKAPAAEGACAMTDADIDRAAQALAAFREAGGLPWDQKMEIARENWRRAVRIVIEALEEGN